MSALLSDAQQGDLLIATLVSVKRVKTEVA